MKEEWQRLKDYPNYCVSNTGEIKNTNTSKVLKQQHRGSQYKFVKIKNAQGYFVCKDVHKYYGQYKQRCYYARNASCQVSKIRPYGL